MTIEFGEFNAEEHQDTFTAIPPGDYMALITRTEKKSNKAQTGHYIEFEFQIIDGHFKGRNLWARLNLWNPSEKAVQISKVELANICRAVCMPRVQNSDQLKNLPMIIVVDVDGDFNRIKGYKTSNVATRPQAQPMGMSVEEKDLPF